jgi:hypothetical protein
MRGQVTTRKSWCSRYLRAVTADTMWLGPGLLGRIPDVLGISRYAEFTPLASGARIRVRDRAGLDGLEKILEPILPTQEDWRVAQTNLYSGKSG